MCENSQVRHGNYHNYYKFRSDDSRSDILRQHLAALWNEIEKEYSDASCVIDMLDVGCNAGMFTDKAHRILEDVTKRKVRAIGVDLDADLCRQASCSYPNIDFIEGNLLNIVTHGGVDDPIDARMRILGIERFDMICCFSVLMYLHLNGGDEGLRAVLDYLCNKGKLLILELQPWKKYRDQQRRLRRDGHAEYPLYERLEWRGGEGKLERSIKSYIVSKGFVLLSETVERNEFDRQIFFFRQI